MSAVALGVAAALVALRCQLITDDPYVLGSVSQVLPATRPAFLRALNATRRLIGCPVADDVPPPVGDFAGGQCPGGRYRVVAPYSIQTVRCPGATAPPQTLTGTAIVDPIFGPISSARFEAITQGECGVQSAQFVVRGRNSSGQPVALTANPITSGRADMRLSSLSASSVTITRTDSQPDDCGSLEGPYPPPSDFTTNIDITYNIDDGTEITVNAPFIFAPIKVDFNGELKIPFTFDLGGFEFSGDINLPDFEVSINPPSLPPGSGDDTTGQGDDEPDETFPPAEIDEKIIGVVVTATQTDSQAVTSYSSPGLTPIFVPRLGSIKFVYSLGAATFFGSDIDIKDRRTFIPCDFSQGADAVIAAPNEGVNITFTPIRGYPLATARDVTRPA